MNLIPELLSADASISQDGKFRAVLDANGVYNTFQFVLRLSPRIHRILSSFSPGITTNGVIGFDGAQAMSTFLHETVHWWQHIGSTYGFILSLNYPVQSHCTHYDLKRLVNKDGFKKSVAAQAQLLSQTDFDGVETAAGFANRILNNHYDLLTYRAFTLGPESAKSVVEGNLFENVGHAFHMTYAHTVNQLASTVDPNFKAFPHPKEWSNGFQNLRDKKVEGYYYGSPVELWPIGSKEIFEGQACFAQLQYLSYACGHRLGLEDFRSLGMLHGVYARGFEEFIRLTESSMPTRVNDPLVNLFLLVCDLSINPGSGFPFSVVNFESFIWDVNPGARFAVFSRLIATKFPELKNMIKNCDRTEYEEAQSKLCEAAREAPPLFIAQYFGRCFASDGLLSGVRSEYESYKFGEVNFVLRHLLAHFLAFQEDKAHVPEFFCWPGAWMAGERVDDKSVRLFDKHGALFIDKENDEAIYSRRQQNRSEKLVQEVFDMFYQHVVIHELSDQWISRPGAFRYDVEWLKPSASSDQMKDYLRDSFKAAFQLDSEAVQILP